MRQDTFAILPNLHVNWVLLGLALAFLAWGCVLVWRWQQTQRDASVIFSAKREQGEIATPVTEADFAAAYVRSESPRAATYFYLCALVCAVLVPPAIAIFSSAWDEIWALTGGWPPTARGTLVHTFSTFLAAMGTMVAVLAFAMRRYHSNTPPNLRQAIQDLNATQP
ncbi:MAG: hypothetical protein AAFY85_06070 [Pseudomonadota bacterium]